MPHRVLVVDDDHAIHALAKESLTSCYTHCLQAFDGETAVRFATEQKPDAILLDMNLPGLTGYEVCQQLKWNSETQDIPVIFLTSRTDITDKVKGMEMGAVDYITKPFDPHELRLRVNSALRSHDSLQMAELRAVTDKRTGLFNQAYLERRIESDAAAAARWDKPLACCLAIIEDWPILSETLGPGNCEHFFRMSAEGIATSLRKEDVACHWDDVGFGVLAFVTDKFHAVELGARIQQAIADAAYMSGLSDGEPVVTVGIAISRYSTGAALLKTTVDTLDDARKNARGQISFGAELMQLRETTWLTN
jgi:two-component system, cell cycle response regulator